MKNILIGISILLISFSFLTGCGSAEAIEQFNYSTTKFKLEKAVMQVLKNNTNPNIIWDSADIVIRKNTISKGMDTINAALYSAKSNQTDPAFPKQTDPVFSWRKVA
ncbi:MAG: hypothetical protein V4450_04670 [Bacteroidota bacterium]